MIPPRGSALIAIILASLLVTAGCLYRVQPTPAAETPEAGQAAPPVTVLATTTLAAAATAQPAEPVAPPPDATTAPPAAETATPTDADLPPPALAADASPAPDASPISSPTTPDATATITATAIANLPMPSPTLPPLPTVGAAVTDTVQAGESLHSVIHDYLSTKLGRTLTEAEIRAGLPYLLDDPANEQFRANPSIVYPGQVVTLSPLDHYLDVLAGRVATPSPTSSAG